MNPTTTETGMAIVARQSPMKPKPTKRERAMRLETLLTVIGKHIQAAGVEFNNWNGKLEICPKDSQPPELREALKAFSDWSRAAEGELPPIRSVTDLLEELKEATCGADQRIYSILSDEATRTALIEEGTRLLGGGN